jgi:hypothetical protein
MKTRILVLLFLMLVVMSPALTIFKAHAEEVAKCEDTFSLGDVTGPNGVSDGVVDIWDLGLVGKEFGARDHPTADFTGSEGVPDGVVDIYDLGLVAKYFGVSFQGRGILTAYTTNDYSTEASKDGGNYQVDPGVTYYLKIQNITEFSANSQIYVWARYVMDSKIYDTKIYRTTIDGAPVTIYFNWTIPSNLPLTTPIKFKYGTNCNGTSGQWRYAMRSVYACPRLLLVVPEIPLGAIGAIAALFTGFKLKSSIRRRK